MEKQRSIVAGVVIAIVVASGTFLWAQQQMPNAPLRARDQTVTPAFEGWYENPDGTFSISFGYYNRNTEQVLEIPIGPDNFIEPGDADQGQPTHFQPRRHWGVFAVRVPADFPRDRKVIWTLKIGGETFSIPGRLHPDWEIDALEGEASSGNTPPRLKFDPAGPEGAGPGGITAATTLTATVGNPVTLTVWATDDGSGRRSFGGRGGRGGQQPLVNLTWFKHQGPGDVTFSEPTARITEADSKATTTATFSESGDYIVRVRANDATGVSGAGHAQCCWTNGFVKVTVSGNND